MASTSIPLSLAVNTVNRVAEVCGLGGHILSSRDLLRLIAADAERMKSVASILETSAKQDVPLSETNDPEVVAREYARVRSAIPISIH